MRLVAFVLAAALALSCRPKPDVSSAPDRSEEVTADKAAPPPGSHELGPVEITDGGGCGALGVTGSYEGALRALRNKAATMGANYLKLGEGVGPHEALGCYDKGYTLRGVAYRAPTLASGDGTSDAGATSTVDGGAPCAVEAGPVGMCTGTP